MAFSPSQQTRKAAGPAPSPEKLPALQPDPIRLAEIEKRGPALMEHAEQAARTQLLRTMNAVRTLAPIMAAAVAQGGNDRDQAVRFSQMLAKSSELATASATALGVDTSAPKNRWILNVLERGFSEVVAADPTHSPALSLATALAQSLPLQAVELPGIIDLGEQSMIRVSLFQGLLPLVTAQQEFDFGRNKELDLTAARDLLFAEVSSTLEFLADPLAPSPERRTMFSLLCQEAGRALADAWRQEALKAKDVLAKKSAADILAWRTANPQGFPIESVYARFRQAMHRIRVLSKDATSR
jgi:hypothetical protein